MKYILSIDQGTTGTTAALVDGETYEFVGKVNCEYKQHYPKPGWVEHDLNDIWSTVEKTVSAVMSECGASPGQISAIGITNQRETTCAFDRSGNPLAKAIVWQDRRTGDHCAELRGRGLLDEVTKKTGLTLDPYFSATKMSWFLNNDPNVQKAAESGELCFGTIDTFLLYKLSGGKSFATESSNASRTLLMDLKEGDWEAGLLKTFNIKGEYLPQIKQSFDDFGTTKGLSFLPDGIPISGILGDQQAALFGQAGHQEGAIKCTYGTGAFILFNTGENIVYSKNGLLTTVAYSYNNKTIYATEGSSYIAGAAVQWLRDNLGVIKSSPEIESLAGEVNSLEEMENVLFLPFFAGIGSPHWKDSAKAAIVGLSRDSSNRHLARACLDGIALSIDDLVEAMKSDTGLNIPELKVDGGAVANNLLMEIQSTVSDIKIVRPKVIETTAYGAALAAAVGAGLIDLEKINSLWKVDKCFSPNGDEKDFYQRKKLNWKKTIERLYL